MLANFSVCITVSVNCGHILTTNLSIPENPVTVLDRSVIYSFLVYIQAFFPVNSDCIPMIFLAKVVVCLFTLLLGALLSKVA